MSLADWCGVGDDCVRTNINSVIDFYIIINNNALICSDNGRVLREGDRGLREETIR